MIVAEASSMGTEFSLETLVRTYNEEFKSQADRISCHCLDRATAEEVLQDSYIKALTLWAQFKCKNHFLAWLHVVARNLALSHYRKNKRMVGLCEEGSEELVATDTSEFEELESRLQAITIAINADRESIRGKIVYRFYVEEMKSQEISEHLKLPLNTVLSHLHRFRAQLRSTLNVQ